MANSVSVIIPTYNGRDLLEQNLASVVKAKKNPANSITEIIVVDDGSSDDTAPFLKKNFKEVRVIRHTKNRRFPAAINTGVKMSKGSLVAFLNNDVSVTDQFLENPVKLFDDVDVFAVSFHEKGYGASKGKFRDGFIVHEGQRETGSTVDTFWASGGSCLVNRKLFLGIGSMDDELFSPFYWEDIDLSYRALKRGYKVLWEPNSLVFHNHESTNSKISKRYRTRIQERNQLLFIWKNLSSSRLLRLHVVGITKRILRHPGYSLVFFSAIAKLFVILKKRKKELKESKISDEAIFAKFA